MKLRDASLIEIYGRDTCGSCVNAKKYLEQNNLNFEYHALSSKPDEGLSFDMVQEKVRNTGFEEEVKTIPQIFAVVNDKTFYIGGFRELLSIVVD